MSEEEKKAIRIEFHNILNALINNKIRPTGTAIVSAEQPMISLFEELMYKLEKQQKEIERLNEIINSRYYHDLKCRELEKEINENWEDKIREKNRRTKKAR